jgi:hypothetical protein
MQKAGKAIRDRIVEEFLVILNNYVDRTCAVRTLEAVDA